MTTVATSYVHAVRFNVQRCILHTQVACTAMMHCIHVHAAKHQATTAQDFTTSVRYLAVLLRQTLKIRQNNINIQDNTSKNNTQYTIKYVLRA